MFKFLVKEKKMITKLAICLLLIALCVSGQYNNCPNGYSPYTIQSGDTFSIIASRYGTTVEAISAANPGVDSRYLQIGQVICVPYNGYNYPTTAYYPTYTTAYYPTTYFTNYPTYPSGYNTNYNTNSPYPSNTYYGINDNGQYNSYYPTSCNNYQVRAGDTCSSLAGASSNYLYQLNPGINCNNLQIGQFICLPYGSNYATMNGYYSGCQNYRIREGDTCSALASQAGVSLNQFYNLNGYLNCNALQVGQYVCLPTGQAGTTMAGYSTGNRCYGRQYTVNYGDTCWAIAQRFGTTVEQLQACNGLNCNDLRPGQVINF